MTYIMNYKNMDCLEYLSTLEDNSIDLIIADPPYYRVVKDEWDHQWKSQDEYNEWCNQWVTEVSRVSKYSGSLWLFGYARNVPGTFCSLTNNQFNFRQQIVVNKGMRAVAGRTKSTTKLFPTTTESLFFFHYEARPHISQLLEEQRIKLNWKAIDINTLLGKSTSGGGAYSGMVNSNPEKMVYPKKEYWERMSEVMDLPPYDEVVYTFNLPKGLSDVWDDINFFDRKEKRIHSTQKPLQLIERLIKTSTNEGANVLDMFSGSGTTAVACKLLNRNFYGCEIDPRYYDLSLERINSLTPLV